MARVTEQRYRDNMGRLVVHSVALHRKTHPAHGFAVVRMLNGTIGNLYYRYSDDPAIAAGQIRDVIDSILGLASDLKRWAEAVDACDPADMNTYGARLTR